MNQANKDLIQMLDAAEIRVASGVQSYSGAVCDILDNYAGKGVTIEYPTGTKRTLEAAVRMCVTTSMNQTSAEITNRYIVENGIEYVRVSAHLGARVQRPGQPEQAGHDNWQGHVFKRHGSEPGYPNLAEATGYDIAENGAGINVNMLGLHGYGCRHSHAAWDKRLRNDYFDKDGNPRIDAEENRKEYERQQKQRAMERAIRKTKRELLVKQSEIKMVAETDVKEMLQQQYDGLSYKLRTQNEKYRQFCTENKMKMQYDRLKVAGFKRQQAAQANGRATAYENEEYKIFKNNLGKNMVSKEEYLNIMSNKVEKKIFIHYADSIKRGHVSPLASYSLYHEIAMELEGKCVGLLTANGIKLKAKSLHCIDRVIGSVEQRRSGVSVDEILETLTSKETKIMPVKYSEGKSSQRFIYKNAEVTINPITKTLIQVNPHHRRR